MLGALLRRSAGRRRRQADLVLAVDFECHGGQRWSAVGGGQTVDDAIAFARGGLPGGCAWQLVGWDYLYGE
jgi:hypothetical protein